MQKKLQNNNRIPITLILVITLITSIVLWSLSYTKEYKGEYKLKSTSVPNIYNSPRTNNEFISTITIDNNQHKVTEKRVYTPNFTKKSKSVYTQSLLPDIDRVERVSTITLNAQTSSAISHRTGNGEQIANNSLGNIGYTSNYQTSRKNSSGYYANNNDIKPSQMSAPTPNMQRIGFPPPPINEDDVVVGDTPLQEDFAILLIFAVCLAYLKYLSKKLAKKHS